MPDGLPGSDDTVSKALDRYIAYWQRLSPGSLEDLRDLAHTDVRFKDPFNDVRGIDAMLAVLRKAFEDADDINFVVQRVARSDGHAYLRWDMSCRPKTSRSAEPFRIEGVSEVWLDFDGHVLAHVDYWDSGEQFYERIPLLGRVIRLIKRRMAA
ncbi:MAG: nuclear transport factor 2 family protein [Geminicoccaceae bacterium]